MPDLIVVALIVALAAGLTVTMLVLGAFAFLRTEQLKRSLAEAYARLEQIEAQGGGPVVGVGEPDRSALPARADFMPQAAPAALARLPDPAPATRETTGSRPEPIRFRDVPTEAAPARPSLLDQMRERLGRLKAPEPAQLPVQPLGRPAPAQPTPMVEDAPPPVSSSVDIAPIAGGVALLFAVIAAAALVAGPSALPREAPISLLIACGLGAVAAAGWLLRRANPARGQTLLVSLMSAGGFVALTGGLWASGAPAPDNGLSMLSPTVAFAGVFLTALAATAAGYRFGRLTFALGWLSGLISPLMLPERPAAFVLFGAILLLTALGLGVATARKWRFFALAGFIGALGWAFAWTNLSFVVDGQGVAAGFLVALAALALAAAWEEAGDGLRFASPMRLEMRWTDALVTAHLVTLLAAAGLGLVLIQSGFAPAPTAAALLLVGAVAQAAAARGSFALLPTLLAPAAAALLWSWPAGPDLQTVDGAAMFFAFAAALALAFSVGGWAMMTKNREPAPAGALGASLAALTPLALLAIAFVRARADVPFPEALWSAAAVALAGLSGAALIYLRAHGAVAAAIPFALTAAGSAALAMLFGLTDIWLPTGLALILPAIAWLDRRVDLQALKLAAAAIALGSVWLFTASLEPLRFTVAAIPVFNQLLAGYGVAVAAFWAASRLFDRVQGRDDVRLVQGLEAGALLLAAALLFMQVRHLANGFDVGAPYATLGELGGQTLALLALATALSWQFGAKARPLLFFAEAIAFVTALSHVAVVGLFVLNPWWGSSPGAVSGPAVFNALVFAYAAPAIAFAGYGALRRSQGLAERGMVAGGAAIALTLLAATLEVRRLFHPFDLASGPVSPAEGWSYVAVWAALAAMLFGVGVRAGSLALRGVGVALMAAALGKGLLVDAPALAGLWRLSAFAALAAAAIGSAYAVYLWGRGDRGSAAAGGVGLFSSLTARRP